MDGLTDLAVEVTGEGSDCIHLRQERELLEQLDVCEGDWWLRWQGSVSARKIGNPLQVTGDGKRAVRHVTSSQAGFEP